MIALLGHDDRGRPANVGGVGKSRQGSGGERGPKGRE